MDRDKSPVAAGTGGLPPTPTLPNRFTAASSSSSGHDISHDISRMPERPPPRNGGHRRAQSEILSLPDDISFDNDLGFIGEGPSFSDETEEDLFSMFLDFDKVESPLVTDNNVNNNSNNQMGSNEGFERPTRIRHQHSQSMDGSSSSSIKAEMLASEGQNSAEAKKAMSAAKLAELALVDPKRAKRIWANRQSAARSKERKMRYIAELERKVQTLQTESTTLSTQLSLLQRDTSGLTSENSELKIRLQSIEQQVRLQDALNDALRDEIQRLKIATGGGGGGSLMTNGGKMTSSFGPAAFTPIQQNSFHQTHHMQSVMAAHQLQQLQLHSQNQPHNNIFSSQSPQLYPNQVQLTQDRSMMKGVIGSGSGSGSGSHAYKDNSGITGGGLNGNMNEYSN